MTQPAESLYNRLVAYEFVRRYVEGKSVADLRWESPGPGGHMLSGSAESVVVVSRSESPESSPVLPANVKHQKVEFPDLPYPDDYFDVVVALELVENFDGPDEMVSEIKRVLRSGGVAILSTPDKQTHSNERNRREQSGKRELYAPEFEELLGRHFARVKTYRQGALAGAVISEGGAEGLSGALVETAGFFSDDVAPENVLPPTRFVLAVCGDSEVPAPANGPPYAVLDRDLRVFEESEEFREDVDLLKAEIARMQRTEVQAFRDALALERREAAQLRNQNKHLQERLLGIERSLPWRLLGLLRRLARAPGAARESVRARRKNG